jgi:hypothetical protein
VLAVTDTSTPDGPAPHPVAPDDAPATVGAV